MSVKTNNSVTPLKSLLALWKKLMSGCPLLRPDYQPDKEGSGWWGCVCGGEAREAAAAVRRVHVALAAHARASPHAQTHALLTVPDEWQLQWAGPPEPAAYLRELSVRARAAHQRLQEHSPDYLPAEIDLRTLMRPERVLCALRAHTAARLARPLHQLTLIAHWDCTKSESEEIPHLVVKGLRLSGCEWRGALRAAGARAAAHCPAPPLLLRYLPSSDVELGAGAGAGRGVEVPLYSRAGRDALLWQVRAPLAADYDSDAALLNAVALYIAPID